MLPDLQSRHISTFSGPWLLPEAFRVPGSNALLARNARYRSTAVGTDVGTRLGYSIVSTPNDGPVTSMYNWLYHSLGALKNVLLYFVKGTGVRFIDLSAISPFTIMTQATAYGADILGGGSRVFAAFYNASGIGMAAAQVYSAANGADPLFMQPALDVPVISEPGPAGLITQGTHRFGYLVASRNGFITRPSPAPGDVFTPVSFTASGGLNIRMLFTGNFPASAIAVYPIMTTAANLDKWFIVPGAVQNVIGGAPAPVSITFSISDGDLQATATDAGPYFNRLTTLVSGVAPFLPGSLFFYGSRMGYVTVDGAGYPVCYFSEPDDYQAVFAATSGVYLPGNLPITTGRELGAVAYLFGPHWTYSTTSNANKPAQWAKPQLVDGAIGTLSVHGVCPNAAGSALWVADESGLYYFDGGQYPARPVSYYQQPDWARINWAAAQAVHVTDDKLTKRVTVLAPLDGATNGTHLLTWDYTSGTDPESVQYSLDNITGYSPGALAMVQNDATKHQELWVGPSAAGSILRANDGTEATPYRDIAAGIAFTYKTALSPGADAPHGQKFHHGARLAARGAGNVALQVAGLNDVRTLTPARSPLALSAAPGFEYLLKWFLQSEQASLQLSTSAADAWCVVSNIEWFWTPESPQR